MRSAKKMLSMVLALTILATTVVFSIGVGASAEDAVVEPVYVQKFTKDNFLGLVEYEKGTPVDNIPGVAAEGAESVELQKDSSKIVFNEDGSFTMDSDNYKNVGIRAVFSIDDGFKNNLEQAQKNADDAYAKNVQAAKDKAEKAGKEFDESTVSKVNPFYNIRYRIEKAMQKDGKNFYMRDAMVYYGFVKNDGTLLPVVHSGGDMYRDITTSFSLAYKLFNDSGNNLVDGDATMLESFDDVQGIFFEIYHWTAYDKGITVGGLTATGTPQISEFKAPEIGTEDEAVAVKWDPKYQQDYSNGPYKCTYSADNGKTEEYKKTKQSGWMKYEHDGCTNQLQTYFKFDRDQFNKAVLIANKETGSHKMKITFQLDSCVDQNGKPVKAQVDITANFYNGSYKTILNEWQEPGTSETYVFDVSDWDINCIAGIRVAVQNYWYYDANGELVEYKKKAEGDPDTDASGSSIKYGTGVERIFINPTVRISPIEVYEEGEIITTAQMTTAAPTTTSNENPGAGYHFHDFLPENQAKEFGNSPDEVIYPTYTEKEGVDKLYDPEYGSVTIRSFETVNKQHQMGWLVYSSEDNATVIPEAVTKRVYNQMKQALAYAQGPGGLKMLACDISVIAAKNPGKNENCSVECQVMVHANDDQSTASQKYIDIGKTSTLLIDVSELDLDNIRLVRANPMNYANVDNKGNACGVTDLEVKFSAVYVAGNKFAPTTKATKPADTKEADAIYELYKQLPSSFDDAESYALLESFIFAYADASVETQDYLASHYKLTMDDYGALLEIYNSLDSFDIGDVDTGSAAAPVAVVMVALAAGFVAMKSRKA